MVPAATNQVVITGFHRSGTSMVAQMLHNAGLPLGTRLVPGDISNPAGHFEDYNIVEFHDAVLNRHGMDWRVSSPIDFVFTAHEKRRLKAFITKRDVIHPIWGFKDPRSCLFLDEWFDTLSNPTIVFVYRHYIHCFDSLVRRHATSFAFNPVTSGMSLSFGLEPELGIKLWMEYNRRIVTFMRDHSGRAILVAHQSLVNRAPLVQELNTRFALGLNAGAPSTIQKNLIGTQIVNHDVIAPQLCAEADRIWQDLEKLAWCASGLPNSSVVYLNEAFEVPRTAKLLQHLNNKENNEIAKGGETASVPDKVDLEFSVSKPKSVLALVRTFVKNDQIPQAVSLIETAIEQSPLHGTLLMELGDLYRRLERYSAAESVYYRAITVDPASFPLLVRLGLSLVGQGRLDEAEYFVRRALLLSPRNSWFLREMVSILVKQEQFLEAFAVIRNGRALLPDDPHLMAQEISLLLNLKHMSEAVMLYLDAVEKFPNVPQLLMEGYRIFVELGRPNEGEEFYFSARCLQIKSQVTHALQLEAGLASIENPVMRLAYRHIVNNTLEKVINGSSLHTDLKPLLSVHQCEERPLVHMINCNKTVEEYNSADKAYLERAEHELSAIMLERAFNDYPDRPHFAINCAMRSIDAGSLWRTRLMVNKLKVLDLDKLVDQNLKGLSRISSACGEHEVALKAFDILAERMHPWATPHLAGRLNRAIDNSKVLGNVPVISLGASCLPWLLLNRWGLRHRPDIYSHSPLSLIWTSTDHITRLISSGFAGITDDLEIRLDGSNKPFPFSRATNMQYVHERGPHWCDNGFARLKTRYADLVASLKNYYRGGKRIFVHYASSYPGNFLALYDILSGVNEDNNWHLVVIDASTQPALTETRPYLIYSKIEAPPPDYWWFHPDHFESERGIAFEGQIAKVVELLVSSNCAE